MLLRVVLTSSARTLAAVPLIVFLPTVPSSTSFQSLSKDSLFSTRKNLYCCSSSRSSTVSNLVLWSSTVPSTFLSRSSMSWILRLRAAASAIGA